MVKCEYCGMELGDVPYCLKCRKTTTKVLIKGE